MTLRVISFDFDGCLFNYNYLRSSDKDVIKHNKHFLDSLKQESNAFSHTITMIGSARQSKELDMRGAQKNNTGSCFLAIQHITRYLKATFNTLLFSDIIGDLVEGTSYKRLLSHNVHQEKHACAFFDNSKVMLLYAQMHHIAMQNPNETITFYFYDDRDDILNGLNNFFKHNPDMIPSKLNLRLQQYAGHHINPVAIVQGTGPANKNYRQTVTDMLDIGFKRMPLILYDHTDSPLIFPTIKTEHMQHYIKKIEAMDDQTPFDLHINRPSNVSTFSCCLPSLSWFAPKQPPPEPKNLERNTSTLKRTATSTSLSNMAL